MYTQDLVEISARHCTEDAHKNARQDERTKEGLQKDSVLDLAQGRLLDPDFAVEDLADNVSLLVCGNPWFVLEGVGRLAG